MTRDSLKGLVFCITSLPEQLFLLQLLSLVQDHTDFWNAEIVTVGDLPSAFWVRAAIPLQVSSWMRTPAANAP